MKIGSLFDGSGGFPLAATLCGIEPVWASEIEPYPIAVTRSRFPNMKHLGSVTDINGAEIEPVDVITFGSPCQDLSVAGKRAGLKHTENGDDETTRSGLFMEAIRIIKEMREATNGEYPRYAVWENVPGAFSSNKGLDFRVVLEEFIRIAEPTAVMPEVPKAGWAYADVYCGDGWSLAYRVLDAQYWGVPQRRRRIYLVADFGGQRAGKILFEREGLRGHLAESGAQREAVAGDAASGIGAADCERNRCVNVMNPWDSQGNQVHDGTRNHVYPTLRGCGGAGYQQGYVLAESGIGADCYGIDHAITTGGNCTAQGPCVYENIQATLKACGPHAVAYSEAIGIDGYNSAMTGDKAATLGVNCGVSSGRNGVCVPYTLKIRSGCEGGGKGALIQTGMSATLATNNDQYLFQPVISAGFKELNSEKARSIGYEHEMAPCLAANKHDACVCIKEQYLFENHSQDSRYKGPLDVCPMLPAQLGTGGNNQPFVVGKEERPVAADGVIEAKTRPTHEEVHEFISDNNADVPHLRKTIINYGTHYIVRRLTPTECARLQGFPNEWGHIDEKANFTDEEYAFWLEARNTHAAINGKAVKDYTNAQMLAWYNKLHTDSSEYKMWGNGIALPCALYVMQGMAEVLHEPRN